MLGSREDRLSLHLAVPGSGTHRLDAAKVVLPKKAALRAGAGAAVRDAATGAELPNNQPKAQHSKPSLQSLSTL